jgi:hypothetical protein
MRYGGYFFNDRTEAALAEYSQWHKWHTSGLKLTVMKLMKLWTFFRSGHF